MRKKEQINESKKDFDLLVEYLKRAASGDHTRASEEEFSNPGAAEAFNDLIASIEKNNNYIVMRLNNSMTTIGDSSCVKEMIEQVNSQTMSITEMRGTGKDLGDSIQNIQDSILSIQDNAGAVMDTSEKCLNDINSSVRIVDDATEQVLDISTQIAEFREKAVKINEIIDMVKKIASKSGLLALNASIEAARAGDAGRSFAVVAGQIKDLSANTTSSAETVVKYVSELMEGIDSLSAAIETTTGNLKEGNESVHKSVEYLDEMNGQIDAIKASVDAISDEINTQMALTENFLASVESIADNYEELSEGCTRTGEHLYKISRDIDKTRSDLARKGANLTKLDWLTVYEIDHLIFTWRIYNNLAGFESLKLEQVNNVTGCKFGKWVAAQTDPKVKNSASFKAAVDSHATLHKYAVASWNAMNAGDRDEALVQFNLAYNAYESFRTAMKALKHTFNQLGETMYTQI